MNRHDRRAQAKQSRSIPNDVETYQSSLEALARNAGFPSVETMALAQSNAVKRLVDRLRAEQSAVSMDDCYLVAATAHSIAHGPNARTFAMQFIAALMACLETRRSPTRTEAERILKMTRSFLEALEVRGFVSLKGIEPLTMTGAPFEGDLSAEKLMPEVAVGEQVHACGYCGRAFVEGDMVAIVSNVPNGPWTSVEVHTECRDRQRDAITH